MTPDNTEFRLGDIVETIKGAKFWGQIIAFDTDDKSPGCTVLAVDPGFAGTKHVYPLKQLAHRAPANPAQGVSEVWRAWWKDIEPSRYATKEGIASEAFKAGFTAAIGAGGQAVAKACAICGRPNDNDLLSDICQDCESSAPWREDTHPAPSWQAVADIVPDGCSGSSLAFSEGVLHVSKDGSGYIAVNEDDWRLEDDRCEGPDGPEGSVHWITRFPAGEMQALRDFLNGADFANPPAQPGWRDMSSAPKDGTEFQAWIVRDDGHGFWEPRCRYNDDEAFEIFGRTDYDIDGWEVYPGLSPVAWQEQPASPQPGDGR